MVVGPRSPAPAPNPAPASAAGRGDGMGERVRVGVVGLVYWGPNLVRALHDVDGAEVTWICDLDAAALEKIGRRYPALRRTPDLDEVLTDESVDAVAIA